MSEKTDVSYRCSNDGNSYTRERDEEKYRWGNPGHFARLYFDDFCVFLQGWEIVTNRIWYLQYLKDFAAIYGLRMRARMEHYVEHLTNLYRFLPNANSLDKKCRGGEGIWCHLQQY